jgi:hypothetical protein
LKIIIGDEYDQSAVIKYKNIKQVFYLYFHKIIFFFLIILIKIFKEILRNMLGFINDMVYSYGSEMRNLIDLQFIEKIINNLKRFKIKKFEDEIFNQEEVIKSIFI